MKNIYSIIIFGMIVLLSINLISAFDFDNVKTYNQETKTIDIRNSVLGIPFLQLGKVAEAKLITPQLNYVIEGKDRQVMIFEIENFEDDIYKNALKDLEILNLNKDREKETKNYHYEFAIYGDVEIKDYETICEIGKTNINGTQEQTCEEKLKGTHLENKIIRWERLNSLDIPKGKITLALVTDVKSGDYYDGIPTLFGVKIDEWAEWTESLNVGLRGYWNFNDGAGFVLNNTFNTSINNGTLTNMEGDEWVAGLLGTALNFGGTDEAVRGLSYPQNVTSLTENYTISAWIKPAQTSATQYPLGQRTTQDANKGEWVVTQKSAGTGQVIWIYVNDGAGGSKLVKSTSQYSTTSWTHIVLTSQGGNTAIIYFNGTMEDDTPEQPGLFGVSADLGMSFGRVSNEVAYSGLLDEVGIWNRILSDVEILQLYNNGAGITYTNEFNTPPVVTLNSPANNSQYSESPQSIEFNCSAVDNVEVSNITLKIDDVEVQTEIIGATEGELIYTDDFTDGNYNWTCFAYDDEGTLGETEIRFFSVDTTPQIEFLTPPTLENYANITQEFIPMAVNVTTNYFQNITYLLQNINGSNYVQFFETEVYSINFTDMPDAHYHYNVTICTTTDKCNWTETRHINHDNTAPELTLNSPTTNFTTLTLPLNISLNFTASDLNLDSCWFNTNDDITNVTITCNQSNGIIFNTGGAKTINFFANDTFGNENSGVAPFTIFYIQESSTATNPITEGGTSSHTLTLNMTDIADFSTTAYLIWNGTSQGIGTKTQINDDVVRFSKTFNVPNINGINATWTWFYNISGSPNVINWNVTGTQSFINLNISECGAGTYVILNYTLYNQETRQLAGTTNASIEVDLSLTSLTSSQTFNFNATKTNSTNLPICLPTGALNNTAFRLDSIAKYSYQEHVVQYHYISNFLLNSSTIPQNINLYDLESAKSTSFLINYQDENYLFVEDAIIDVWRRYVGDGVFISVEHGKTDAQGQTRLHLVTEDIIYKFLVWIDGEVVYSSPEYLALCQATPCQINLRKTINETDGLSERDNLIYSYEFDKTTRTASFIFATKDATETTINMTILSSNSYENETACSTILTTSGGQIDCLIPTAFTNTTYQTIIMRDGEYFGTAFDSLAPSSFELFGYTGIILTAIAFLLLALMGISSGIATIIFGIIGLVFMGLIQIFESGSIFGLASAIIWLVVAGVIIIVKITKRRIQ